MKDSLDLSTISQSLVEAASSKHFLSNEVQIRNQCYIISMSLVHGKQSQLDLEVESKESADQWKGTFDLSAIETMTAKTGNFKSFNVFVNMLENAINQESSSVSVDLFTYDDLESLRRKRQGQTGQNNLVQPSNVQLANKRYLILTYNAEYDRIYYPLSLPYCGKPNPVDLLEKIRQLKAENEMFKSRLETDVDRSELIRSQRESLRLKKENQELRQQLNENRRSNPSDRDEEMNLLRQMLRASEEALAKERASSHRNSMKKSDDYSIVNDQIESLRSSERQLKAKVRTLTNEINLLKRNNLHRPTRNRSTSKERLTLFSGSPRSSQQSSDVRPRLSRPVSGEKQRRTRSDHLLSTVSSRNRSNSNDSRQTVNHRRQRSSSINKRSPSPSDSRSRFDPTEYIREKNIKLRQIEMQKNEQIRRRRNSSRRGSDSELSDRSIRMATSSASVVKSRMNESDDGSRRSNSRRSSSRKRSEIVRRNKFKDSSDSEIEQVRLNSLRIKAGSTTTTHLKTSRSNQHSSSDQDQQNVKASRNEANHLTEMIDIDERLKSLEKFMKETLPN